jgi:small subunit ribosomal protein S17
MSDNQPGIGARYALAWSSPMDGTRRSPSRFPSRRHPRYDKIVRTSSKFHAHDETNDAHVGDTVRIMETRPLSKQKRWRVVEIVERAR